MIYRRVLVGLLAALAVGETSAQAQSLGYMRMPSTLAQYVGCGYGAGHHAPIVRTPLVRPERVPRMTVAPPCDPLYPAGYQPIGCYGEPCYRTDVWDYSVPAAYRPIMPAAPTVVAPEAVIPTPAPSATPATP
jgi:hypothetical protein